MHSNDRVLSGCALSPPGVARPFSCPDGVAAENTPSARISRLPSLPHQRRLPLARERTGRKLHSTHHQDNVTLDRPAAVTRVKVGAPRRGAAPGTAAVDFIQVVRRGG